MKMQHSLFASLYGLDGGEKHQATLLSHLAEVGERTNRRCGRPRPTSFVVSGLCSLMFFSATVLLGLALSARAQVVADGETNTLDNVITSIAGDVTVGTVGSFTGLLLTNGAILTNTGAGAIGLNTGANSNFFFLRGPNTRWRMNGSMS